MSGNRVPQSFWIICAVALVWNALGATNFVVQLNPDMHESYRDVERLIIVGRPLWATIGFALAVFGGLVGCLLLLLNNSYAYYIFVASLLGIILTIAHALSVGITFGPGEIIGIIVLPLLVAVFLTWYSKLARKKGWIN